MSQNFNHKKYERHPNLFFGDIPNDLILMSQNLYPTEKAGEWQDYVEQEILKLGYFVKREVFVPLTEFRSGRIDLVATKNGVNIAIELDYRRPRKKSILKVKTYENGMVLLRNPKIVKKKNI